MDAISLTLFAGGVIVGYVVCALISIGAKSDLENKILELELKLLTAWKNYADKQEIKR